MLMGYLLHQDQNMLAEEEEQREEQQLVVLLLLQLLVLATFQPYVDDFDAERTERYTGKKIHLTI